MKKTVSGYRLIFGYLGLFIILIGVACLLPLFLLIPYPEEASDWYCFAIPGISAIVLGILLFMLVFRHEKAQLGKHQDSVLLVLVWVVSIMIASVPFIIKGSLDVTGSIFETTSAFATVGLTVFSNADYASHLFVFYRSILCFFGGIGLVLIITSAISDRYGLKLYVAEGHNDKLMPNLAKSARLILSIYFGIIVLGVLLYCLAGMPVFDAVIHSISAVATGGFTATSEGLMHYASLPNFWAIQVISCVLMILGSINFLIHMFILTGRFKKVFRDCEVRLFGILCLVFIPLFFLAALAAQDWSAPLDALSHGAFTFVSSITTTGFSNVSSVVSIGDGVLFLVIICNIIGGGMGSTAGGIKQYRLAVAAKSFYWSTRERSSSSNLIYPHYIWRFGEQKEVKANETSDAYGYILLYILIMLFGGFLITLLSNGEFTFGESLFEFSNAISSTGLTNGLTAASSNGVRWVLIVGMFAGRLEILGIYFALFRIIRDVFKKETI